MFTELSDVDIQKLIGGELGINVIEFMKIVDSMGTDNVFVDLGVEKGKSSKILLNKAIQYNNKVYGVDPRPCLESAILQNPNYTIIKGDSVSTGMNWCNGDVSIVFVDSIHVKPQVMCELKHWWNLVKVGGWMIFHDTNWTWIDENGVKQYYIHKKGHPSAGNKAGSCLLGCDTYCGVDWPTPDHAVKEFFNIESLSVDNDIIKVTNGEKDLGMTFIYKKKEYDYSKYISNDKWEQYRVDREKILKVFM